MVREEVSNRTILAHASSPTMIEMPEDKKELKAEPEMVLGCISADLMSGISSLNSK